MTGTHAYADTQPPGSHLDEKCNIQKYTTDQLSAYWAMVYTLALIAGVAGDKDEQEAARNAVKEALADAVETVGSYGKAAQIVADDYLPTNPMTLPFKSETWRAGETLARGVESYFGYETSDNDKRIEALDQQIRDKTAVQINRGAGFRKTVKGWVGADTSAEDAEIAKTQATVDARNREVMAAFNRLWAGIKEVALARYNQFVKERNACGVSYALQTLGVDGGFLVVETVVQVGVGAVTGGAGAVALKLAVHVGKTAGKIVVKISRAGRVLRRAAGRNEGTLALEEKKVVAFGKKHNGYGDDQGGHPVRKADEEPGGPDTAKTARQRGQDRNTKGTEGEKYYTDKYGGRSLQNGSGNGFDHIDDKGVGKGITFTEVKTSEVGDYRLRGEELLGGENFAQSRLTEMSRGEGRYKSLSQGDKDYAQQLLDRLESGESVNYQKVNLKKNPDGTITEDGKGPWNRDDAAYRRWRDGQQRAKERRAARKTAHAKGDANPATGPPAPE